MEEIGAAGRASERGAGFGGYGIEPLACGAPAKDFAAAVGHGVAVKRPPGRERPVVGVVTRGQHFEAGRAAGGDPDGEHRTLGRTGIEDAGEVARERAQREIDRDPSEAQRVVIVCCDPRVPAGRKSGARRDCS